MSNDVFTINASRLKGAFTPSAREAWVRRRAAWLESNGVPSAAAWARAFAEVDSVRTRERFEAAGEILPAKITPAPKSAPQQSRRTL